MSWDGDGSELAPDAAPAWLKPLVDNAKDIKHAYRRRVSPEVLAMVTAANTKAAVTGARRDAAVLVLFSGPPDSPSGGVPDQADLLVTVRAFSAAQLVEVLDTVRALPGVRTLESWTHLDVVKESYASGLGP